MTEPDTPPDAPRRRSLGAELIIPLAAIVFALYYFSTIVDSPWTAQVGAFFVGAILVALCVVFVAKAALEVSRGRANLRLSGLATGDDLRSGRVLLLVLTLLYVAVIPWGGFTITTFLFLLASMAVLNRGRALGGIIALSLTITLTGYLLFIVAFNTRFPRGPFEELMKGLF